MHLFDLFTESQFLDMMQAGYIKAQTHPTAPYIIYNYTDSCTWDEAWNEVTLQCRGLIVHAETNKVIARPIRKFFNYDQEQAPNISLNAEVTAFDKADGSLGILYPMPDGSTAVATRGSFSSEQAVWATKFWNENLSDRDDFLDFGFTYLFEIIYPENRVVVDYGSVNTMRFLGAVSNETGKLFTSDTWPFSDIFRDCVQSFGTMTFGELLSLPARPNAEGYVVHAYTGMVKIKFDEYKRLHKYLTRVNERHIWEVLSQGKNLETEFAGAPDEFHVWVKQVAETLTDTFKAEFVRLDYEFENLTENLFEASRKDYAAIFAKHPDRAAMFLLLDGATTKLEALLWRQLRPVNPKTIRLVSNDAD